MKSTKNRAISIMICLLMLAQIVPSSWFSVLVFAYSSEPEEMANTKNDIDLPIDPFHVLSYVAAKDATCTELGNIEYWYCADCGQAWLDEACTLNTNLMAVVLPMVDHTYDNDYDVDCNECGAVPEVHFDTVIAARPYFIYENEAGEQIVVYGEETAAAYNGVLNG